MASPRLALFPSRSPSKSVILRATVPQSQFKPRSSFSRTMATTSNNPIQQSIDETHVEYRRLGNSGLRVSVPIFGTMSFGLKAWQPWLIEEEEALPLLKAAYDRGLTTWDTSNSYTNGVCEQIIGAAIKKYDLPRRKLVLMSKCWGVVADQPEVYANVPGLQDSKDYVNQSGLSRKAIFNAVEGSLKRLGTDYLDVLHVHRFDPAVPIEETMLALHDLVRSGKVLYIGASSMWLYQFAQMQFCAEKNGWTKFICMQNHHNLLYREEEREMIPFCKELGVGVIPYMPLSRGHLARPADEFGSTTRSSLEKENNTLGNGRHDSDLKIINRVEEIAKKRGWSMSQVALTWSKSRVTSPICGFSSIARIDDALGIRGKQLTAEEVKYLEEPYPFSKVIGHS